MLTHFAVLPINSELTRKLIGKHHTPNMNQITFHHIVQKIDFCWKDKHSKFPCDSTINRMTFYFLGQVYRWGHLLCSTDIQFEGHPNSRVYRFRGSINSIKCSKYHWPEQRYLLFVCLFEFYVSGTTIMCVCDRNTWNKLSHQWFALFCNNFSRGCFYWITYEVQIERMNI